MDTMEELIRRECDVADELAVIVIQCDEIIHTNEHPFCDDMMCPCRADFQLIMEYVYQPVQDGLLTADEGKRLYYGKQL